MAFPGCPATKCPAHSALCRPGVLRDSHREGKSRPRHSAVWGTTEPNAMPRPTHTLHAVGGEEGDVPGLQRVFVGEVRRPGLRFRLAGEGGVIHLPGRESRRCAEGARLPLRGSAPGPPASRPPPTLQPLADMILRSAGMRSPPFTSTRSPTTTSSALMLIFSPFRITRACFGGRRQLAPLNQIPVGNKEAVSKHEHRATKMVYNPRHLNA